MVGVRRRLLRCGWRVLRLRPLVRAGGGGWVMGVQGGLFSIGSSVIRPGICVCDRGGG